jgi:hypothetical protein
MEVEIMWEVEASLSNKIEASWNNNTHARNIKDINTKLKCIRGSLNVWKKQKF